jgi:hypothetical protein
MAGHILNFYQEDVIPYTLGVLVNREGSTRVRLHDNFAKPMPI